MRRLWLAAILGVIIGFSVAVSSRPTAPQEKGMIQVTEITGANQPLTFQQTGHQTNELQYVVVGLLAGIAVALPIFLVSRRRLE